jgi:GntR family transcriptional regulator
LALFWYYIPAIEDAAEESLFMTVVSADRYPFDPTAVSSDRPLPLYLQLADHLRHLIIQGALADRDVLPGEREIAERLGVSRVTVRKALQILAEEGLLDQRQGSGNFVNRGKRVEQPLSALTSFTDDMRSRGMRPASQWLHRGVSVATPEEALVLGLRPGEKVSRLRRLRTTDGTPMAIELATVPCRFLPDPEVVRESLYEVLRGSGYPPFRALQRLSAVQLNSDQAALLHVPTGAAALYIERRTFLEDNIPLELVRSQYRGDAYDFVVELNLSGATATRPSSENRS